MTKAQLLAENERLRRELAGAQEQRTATSDILRVIASSPSDLQPVFDTIAERAMRLCGGAYGWVMTYDGQLVHLSALANVNPEGTDALRQIFPYTPDRRSATGRSIMTGQVAQIPDVLADPSYEFTEMAQAVNYRSGVTVPMLHQGRVIGVVAVTRPSPGAFSPEQIQILSTFADQAVIAIENVRLFKELEARNRDLTATSEILQVISRSPTDVQPVFSAIAKSAAHLTGAVMATVYEFDGGLIRLRVVSPDDWPHADDLRRNFPTTPARNFAAGRVVLDRAVLHRADLQNDPDTPELTRALAGPMGLRGVLWVPMLRDGEPAGVIGVAREESALFSDEQVRLLQTFADQAVIAIENVRLFTELQARNRDLTGALARQTATSEVLRVISRSQTDLQPVFAAILDCAVRLCGADTGGICRVENGRLFLVEFSPNTPENLAVMRGSYPRPVDTTSLTGRAVVEARVVHVPDVEDPTAPPVLASVARGIGFRSHLSVPILRGAEPIGALALQRRAPGPFSEPQIDLVRTFADQAVIAIENARLLAELQARTAALTRSVEQLTALGEVGQAVSSTLDLETVLTTIVSRANQLSGTDAGAIYEYDEDGEEFHLRATQNLPEDFVEYARPMGLRKGEGATGRLAETREPVGIADIAEPHAYHSRLRDVLLRLGYRALLAVPLMRENHVIGGLIIHRKSPGAFPPETVVS